MYDVRRTMYDLDYSAPKARAMQSQVHSLAESYLVHRQPRFLMLLPCILPPVDCGKKLFQNGVRMEEEVFE